MSKKKEEQKSPLGFVANPNQNISVSPQAIMELLKAINTVNNIGFHLRNELFNTDQIRYYFEDDLIEVEGQKQLRTDFWEIKKES